eukprot:1160970-Pelagomonas_calceolata.AAC.3
MAQFASYGPWKMVLVLRSSADLSHGWTLLRTADCILRLSQHLGLPYFVDHSHILSTLAAVQTLHPMRPVMPSACFAPNLAGNRFHSGVASNEWRFQTPAVLW